MLFKDRHPLLCDAVDHKCGGFFSFRKHKKEFQPGRVLSRCPVPQDSGFLNRGMSGFFPKQTVSEPAPSI